MHTDQPHSKWGSRLSLTSPTSGLALQGMAATSPHLSISPPRNEMSLPYSPSVSYTFILFRDTLASAPALTEKGKIAMENFITLNMAITLNAWRAKERHKELGWEDALALTCSTHGCKRLAKNTFSGEVGIYTETTSPSWLSNHVLEN